MIADGGGIDAKPGIGSLQGQLALAVKNVTDKLPVDEILGMVDRYAGKIVERRVDQIEIIANTANRRVGMVAGEDRIPQLLGRQSQHAESHDKKEKKSFFHCFLSFMVQMYKKILTFANMMAENTYIKQFPDLMEGKTVLYVHGFASSGQSGTVKRLQEVLPNAKVVAPDLPIHPQEALTLLHDTCKKEQPALIIGTSMGGMFTEQLRGFDRICVNPALDIAETMRQHGLTGTQQFQNPRKDGVQEFYVDKALVKEYREVSEQRFEGLTDEDRQRVYGLFGDQDELVDTFGMFSGHYPQATHFHGEHRMNDKSFMHSVVPVIRWIDDRQEKRERHLIYIGIETLWDSYRKPASSAQKAVRSLIEHYQVFFVAPNCDYEATEAWLAEYFDVPAWQHTLFTPRRDLLYGDYLIVRQEDRETMATCLEFGSDTFKSWDDLIVYFSRLGGQ